MSVRGGHTKRYRYSTKGLSTHPIGSTAIPFRFHRGRHDVTTPEDAFVRDTGRFRRELLAHCYRMVGSPDEAEDLVQETYLRAWRAYGRFEGRSSARVWLYRIATNVCLTALYRRGRRELPSGLGEPTADPGAEPELAGAEVSWLRPMPDALVTPETADPAAVVAAREGLRLALLVSLQHLPARQRAVLILRDVLGFRAGEVAEMLETSTAAVKSALQRARGRLAEVAEPGAPLGEPDDPRVRALLAEYIRAFENSDPAAMERALRTDAAIEPIGARTWFAGKATCAPYLASVYGPPGSWRMIPTVANGQPAVVSYLRDGSGVHRAFGVVVLSIGPDDAGTVG
jgi:RNA polymerase sigma-70 factor (ECF subfamily)